MYSNSLLLLFVQAFPPEVVDAIEQTAMNTNAHPWTIRTFCISVFSLLVGIIAAIFAFMTWRSQRQTERNTYRLIPEVQKNLLIEMCRHLYRNRVISYTLSEKMRISGYSAYPSEEHLQKMKVNLEDIHDEIFYKSEKEFFQISKLYMYLRNYNAELDIISDHFHNPTIDVDTKRRDVATLLFKCDFLISEIFDFIVSVESVWKKLSIEEVRAKIIHEIEENRKKFMAIPSNYKGDYIPYETKGTEFTKRLYPETLDKFLAEFNKDVLKEMGVNTAGGEKFQMIKLT